VETYNFLVGVGTLLVSGALLYYTRESVSLMRDSMSARQRAAADKTPWWRTKPVIAVVILAALTWVPWIYGLAYPARAPATEEVSDYNYGNLPDGDQFILATLKTTKPDKKVIGMVLHYNGLVDIKDAKGLQKSAPYDYTEGQKIILIDPDETFRREVQLGARGTNYFIIEVPKNVSSDQFNTLRQAENLGGTIIFQKAKTP
jgi:hypothetical protein